MANRTLSAGFYGNDHETYYVAPSGRMWIVSTPDSDQAPQEIWVGDMLDGTIKVDDLLTPEESLEYCRQVQDASGEILLEEAE